MPVLMSSSLMDPALEGHVPIPSGPPTPVEETTERGHWPRMLELSPEVESRLTEYLRHELSECWRERNLLVEDWKQWQKDYWAKPDSPVRNFPFRKAANIVIPMTAIAVEAVYARLLNTIFAVKPFWSIRPQTRNWIDVAPKLQSYLQIEAENIERLDAYGFAQESLLELVKLGTGVGKSGYIRDVRKVNIDLPGGGSRDQFVEMKNGATLDYVPLANFLLRLHEHDPQTATWVGEEHFGWSWAQMKREALSGRISAEALDKIKHYWSAQKGSESNAQAYDDARRLLENAEPGWHDKFDFQEIWISFDVDNDGVDEEIVVDFHHDSGTLLSCRYNWYRDLHRPYRIGVYMPVEGRWAGIGVGKQNEQFQPLITTIHRQRLDAGTLANMGQLAIKKSSGYGPGEPIFPGKLWFVDDTTDIKAFQLSNHQHLSQIQNEDAARQYSDKRTGVNEIILGMPHMGTPGTATSDLAKLAEGNKKFDMVLRNVRRWYGQLGSDVLANMQQFGNQDLHWLVQEQDGQFVEMFLTLPAESIRKGAAVVLTVTDSITNKDVEQQKWMSLFSVLTGNYNVILEKAMMVMQITGDPTVFLMMADMALRASNETTRRLLETFNVPDVENFLLDLRQAMAQNGIDPTQPGATGGGGRPPLSTSTPGSSGPALVAGAAGGGTAPARGPRLEPA